MTTEQILQECKEVYATNYGFENYADFQHKLSIGNSNANDFQDAIELLATQLYAQKIAELFSEWILTERVGLNREKGFVYPRESWDYYDHKGLYQIFLNQLNSTK